VTDVGQFETKTEYIWSGYLILAPGHPPKWRQQGAMGSPGDRVMKIEVRAPRALWDITSMSATITVGDQAQPDIHIDTEAAAEALSAVVGTDVRVIVETAQEKEAGDDAG